jgi:hypothetical protein
MDFNAAIGLARRGKGAAAPTVAPETCYDVNSSINARINGDGLIPRR